MINILVVPKDSNPYQELLYSNMRNVHRVYANEKYSFLLWPLDLIINRLKNTKLLHIHWLYFLSFPNHIPFNKALNTLNLALFFILAKILGYKIIWTVHNILPHEQQSVNDSLMAVFISKISKSKIVHSQHVIDQMKQMGYDISKSYVIPHGNYQDVYSDIVSRRTAREKLKVKTNEKLLLFIGNIRPYKGLDELVEIFINNKFRNTKLIIAGECTDRLFAKYLTSNHSNNILFHDGRVEDSDIAMYLRASDIVCLPFKTITTSGSALLALTFGKPIVAPRIGAIQDIPSDVGVLYDPRNNNALENALAEALSSSSKLFDMSRAAQKYSDTLSWDKIATRTFKVYEDVLREI